MNDTTAKADPVRALVGKWRAAAEARDEDGFHWQGHSQRMHMQSAADELEAALAQQAGADKPFAYVEPGTFNATDAGDFEVVAAAYPGVYDHYVPVYRAPQPAIPEGAEPNGELVGWWNGIMPDITERSPYGPSVRWGADAEDSAHDIPLYDGYNPIHYATPQPTTPLEAMDIVRRLAALRDGLENSNSSAEEAASRLAARAATLAAAQHNREGA